jgi:diacylglycerol kinase family enzyme
MKWLAIINPRSRGQKTEGASKRLLRSLEPLTSNTVVTQHRGHAEELARTATGFDGIVVVGGDGTVHEVLKGLNVEDHLLAIIPAGTGNSLARDLGLTNTKAALASIKTGNSFPVDLMQLSFKDKDGVGRNSVSASTVALGYPVATTITAEKRLKGLGKLCYPLAATFESLCQKHFSVQLNYGDGGRRESRSLTGLLINNTRHIANFLAFPNAAVDDGKLEVMELRAGCMKQIAHNLSILSRSYFYTPAPIRREASLLLDLASPQQLMIDGEIYPEVTNLKVQILPRRLRCVRRNTVHP